MPRKKTLQQLRTSRQKRVKSVNRTVKPTAQEVIATVNAVELDYEDFIERVMDRDPSINIARDPEFNGMTPDILATADDGAKCIVECTSIKTKIKCDRSGHSDALNFDEFHRPLYDACDDKLRTYTPSVIGIIPLVVAVKNLCCDNFATALSDVAVGPIRSKEGRWVSLWAGTPYAAGIFGQYPHCSGILMSSRSDDIFMPNPFTTNAADPRFFSFARFCGKPVMPNGQMTIKDAENPHSEYFDKPHQLSPEETYHMREQVAKLDGIPVEDVFIATSGEFVPEGVDDDGTVRGFYRVTID